MSAVFKSHVLRRDEKGFAGIPFKRLLLAAVSGGLTYTGIRLTASSYAIAIGIVVGIVSLILSSTQGGLPRWQRWGYGLRGWWLLRAARQPEGLAAQLARLFDLPLHLMQLDAQQLFGAAAGNAWNIGEWVTFSQAADADRDDGLALLDDPYGMTSP